MFGGTIQRSLMLLIYFGLTSFRYILAGTRVTNAWGRDIVRLFLYCFVKKKKKKLVGKLVLSSLYCSMELYIAKV